MSACHTVTVATISDLSRNLGLGSSPPLDKALEDINKLFICNFI